jgi:hypothetical protein
MAFGTPHAEYTLQNYTVQLVNATQQQMILCGESQNRAGLGVLEDLTYGPKYENKQAPGSGTFPRAHGSVIGKPMASLTVDQDTAALIDVFRGGADGVVDLFITRQLPGGTPIVDAIRKWKPLTDEASIKTGGEITTIKVQGQALGFEPDYYGTIVFS